jgi:hypothetical protein
MKAAASLPVQTEQRMRGPDSERRLTDFSIESIDIRRSYAIAQLSDSLLNQRLLLQRRQRRARVKMDRRFHELFKRVPIADIDRDVVAVLMLLQQERARFAAQL